MSWTLSLSVASAGMGAAKLGADSSPQATGFFPAVDRAVAFSAEGESSRIPDAVLLLVPSTLSSQDLKWYLGELVIAGVAFERIQVQAIPEVLRRVYGGEILFVDASWKKIVAADGNSEELNAERLGELHDAQPADTTVILAGHREERGSVHDAIAERDPVPLDFPGIAALALEAHGPDSPPSGSSPMVTTPADPVPPGSTSPLTKVVLLLAVVIILVLVISFLI